MPVTPTYPGVYIEEIPSGVRTITGVATSITAFIGRAIRGPVDDATRIQSFGDFERTFGDLWLHSTMSYAVRHYFQNGGMDAIIVRITNSAATATAGLTADSDALTLETANAGAWGNYLRAAVDYDTSDPDNQFNLTIEEIDDLDSTDPEVVSSEVFRNLSVDSDDSNYVEKVLEEESTLVRVQGDVPADRPDEAENESFTGGDDGSDLADSDYQGSESDKTGIYALEDADLFNLLCIPPRTREDDIGTAVLTDTALPYCKDRRAILTSIRHRAGRVSQSPRTARRAWTVWDYGTRTRRFIFPASAWLTLCGKTGSKNSCPAASLQASSPARMRSAESGNPRLESKPL